MAALSKVVLLLMMEEEMAKKVNSYSKKSQSLVVLLTDKGVWAGASFENIKCIYLHRRHREQLQAWNSDVPSQRSMLRPDTYRIQ